jgi:hypothetical protein
MSRSYEEFDYDNKLLHAIDMYWEIRRLSVQVRVMIKDDFVWSLILGDKRTCLVCYRVALMLLPTS